MQAMQSQTADGQDCTVQTRERNTEELRNLVSRYLPLFYKRAYRYLGNSYDAEDAVQDALLSAYKHLDQFKGGAKMATWLTRIVMNSALTQLRKRPRQCHSSLDEPLAHDQNSCMSDRLADVRPNPEDECAMIESYGHLMRAMGKLSPSSRKLIQLRVFDELTTSEMADILGVPETTIKSRILRARLELKRRAQAGPKRAFSTTRLRSSAPSPKGECL